MLGEQLPTELMASGPAFMKQGHSTEHLNRVAQKIEKWSSCTGHCGAFPTVLSGS